MAITANPKDDAHLRYVDEEGRVLYIQHQFTDAPGVGKQVQLNGDTYNVVHETHKFNSVTDEKEHIELTVNPV